MRYSTVVIAFSLTLGGCSSQILISDIPNDLAAGSEVSGIPFRMSKRFVATVYEKRKNGYQKIAENLVVTIPDPDHLYVLGFRSQVFSTASIDLTLNADNTIQKVILTSESKGAAAITAASTQLNAIAAAEQARAKASTAATAAATSSVTTAAGLAIAADKAKQTADLAALQYQVLSASAKATPEELLKAQQRERSTKLDANEAARLAGKAPYFPDVYP
jgi:hypothetical protein